MFCRIFSTTLTGIPVIELSKRTRDMVFQISVRVNFLTANSTVITSVEEGLVNKLKN